MQDGTPWPGNNTKDHPGMIQVFLGHSGGLDAEGKELPRLVYVSREKRPGFQHHKKAGAMNALVREKTLFLLFIILLIPQQETKLCFASIETANTFLFPRIPR